MKINPKPSLKGPINGENFTSDTRNYPWHRPPENTGLNEAIDRSMKDMEEEKEQQILYSLLDLEMPVKNIVSNFLQRKIIRGIIPIDLAVLMAGPIARYIEILAKDNGFTPDMDMESTDAPITSTSLRLRMGSDEEVKEDLGVNDDEALTDDISPAEGMEESPEGVGGLMAPIASEGPPVASAEEQASMLGETEPEGGMMSNPNQEELMV